MLIFFRIPDSWYCKFKKDSTCCAIQQIRTNNTKVNPDLENNVKPKRSSTVDTRIGVSSTLRKLVTIIKILQKSPISCRLEQNLPPSMRILLHFVHSNCQMLHQPPKAKFAKTDLYLPTHTQPQLDYSPCIA